MKKNCEQTFHILWARTWYKLQKKKKKKKHFLYLTYVYLVPYGIINCYS